MLAALALSFNVNAQEGTGRGGGDPIVNYLHNLYPDKTDCEIAFLVVERAPGDVVLDIAANDPEMQNLISSCGYEIEQTDLQPHKL